MSREKLFMIGSGVFLCSLAICSPSLAQDIQPPLTVTEALMKKKVIKFHEISTEKNPPVSGLESVCASCKTNCFQCEIKKNVHQFVKFQPSCTSCMGICRPRTAILGVPRANFKGRGYNYVHNVKTISTYGDWMVTRGIQNTLMVGEGGKELGFRKGVYKWTYGHILFSINARSQTEIMFNRYLEVGLGNNLEQGFLIRQQAKIIQDQRLAAFVLRLVLAGQNGSSVLIKPKS
jgi:hypothetical protein